jgi:uncharacterized protein (TIGR00369 family)
MTVDDRVRSYSWADPLATLEAAAGLSGLEVIRRIAAGELAPPPIAVTLGMSIDEANEGRAVFSLEAQEWQYNPIGSVHGGVAATLLDSAMGCAVHTTLPAGVGYSTLDISVRYLRAITSTSGWLRCEGTVISSGRRTATATGSITDGADRLVATGTTTCLLLR